MSRARLPIAVLAILAILAVSHVAGPGATAPPDAQVDSTSLVQPGETDEHLWPYTSRYASTSSRTLAINLVVLADADAARDLLTDTGDWQRAAAGGDTASVRARVTPTGLAWQPAHGSDRYTYVTPDPEVVGRWLLPAWQQAAGPYLGTRTHVRGYDGGAWTALQVHHEYWDWFRLRHTVTGVSDPADALATQFERHPRVDRVRTVVTGLEGGGSDGTLGVVELAALLALVVPVTRLRRTLSSRRVDAAVLPLAVAAVPLAVRATGIAVETAVPAIPPKAIAAPLYLALALGLPAVAYAASGRLRPGRAFALAGTGLAAGLVLEALALGIATVPPRLALHRGALLVAVGLIAAGDVASTPGRRRLSVGATAWIVALALPLFGYL